MKKIRNKTEEIIKRTELLLPSFAMYFLHDREKASCFAQECYLLYVEKLKSGKCKESVAGFLFREIRRKCFDFLCEQGKIYKSTFIADQNRLKSALSAEKGSEEILYEELLAASATFELLAEQEREIVLLVLGCCLTYEECAFILDRSVKEVEELYLLALMKLGTKTLSGNDLASDPGKMIRLTRSISFLLTRGGEEVRLTQEQKENILAFASAGTPLDCKKILYKAGTILLFCLFTAGIMIYSHLQGDPELTPEVKIGVFMPEEELKTNLLQEKERQEKLRNVRKKNLTAIQLSLQNFSGLKEFKAAAVEKKLKKLGVNVKVYKVEIYNRKSGKIYVYVDAADALKISRSRKVLK